MLSAFLGDQLAASAVESRSSDTAEILACREVLASLGALIMKVEAASRATSERVRATSELIGLTEFARTW
jgi:hypothetical protein